MLCWANVWISESQWQKKNSNTELWSVYGKVMKHVLKQDPLYIGVTTEVRDESFKRWYITIVAKILKMMKKLIIHQEVMMMKVWWFLTLL